MMSKSLDFRFDGYYKRRINRVYPSVLAWTLIGGLVFPTNQEYHAWGGWFIPCIMLYYAALYVLNKLLEDRLNVWFVIALLLAMVWYYCYDKTPNYYVFDTKISWAYYFFSFLVGVYASQKNNRVRFHCVMNFVCLLISVVLYFGLTYIVKKYSLLNYQWVVFIPLSVLPFFAYKVLSQHKIVALYKSKYVGWIMQGVGGLCLEIFLVQLPFITDNFNFLFPLNIFFVFAIIVFVAYLLRTVGRLAVQTFDNNVGYSYRDAFRIVG